MIWLRIGGDIDVQVSLAQVIQNCNWNIEANKIDKNVLRLYVIDYF